MLKVTEEQWKTIFKNIPVEYQESRKDYVDRMKHKGFEIYYPNENELTLDIDTEEAYEHFLKMFERFEIDYGPMNYSNNPSKSGLPNRHIIIQFPVLLTNESRIALQLLLGSDVIREMLSLWRCFTGDEYPSLLAMKKDTQEK